MLKLVEAFADQTHPCLQVEAQMDSLACAHVFRKYSVKQGREVHSTYITDEDPKIHAFSSMSVLPRGFPSFFNL